MKNFKFATGRYYVFSENTDDGTEGVKYEVFNTDSSDSPPIATFVATESLSYDNSNILCFDIPLEIFGEVFSRYQEFLQMPVFFCDTNLSDEYRNKLLEIGATFCKDVYRETRWFNTEEMLYRLGQHVQ